MDGLGGGSSSAGSELPWALNGPGAPAQCREWPGLGGTSETGVTFDSNNVERLVQRGHRQGKGAAEAARKPISRHIEQPVRRRWLVRWRTALAL